MTFDNIILLIYAIPICVIVILAFRKVSGRLYERYRDKRSEGNKSGCSDDGPGSKNEVDAGYILPPIGEEEHPQEEVKEKPEPVKTDKKSQKAVRAKSKAKIETNRVPRYRGWRIRAISQGNVLPIWLISTIAASLVIGNGIDAMKHSAQFGWVEIVFGAVLFGFMSYWCIVSVCENRKK